MPVDILSMALFGATLFAAMLRATTPVLFAALGGLIAELAGTTNVALDGLMLISAFVGVIVSAYVPLWFPHLPLWAYPFIGGAAGICAAIACALLLALCHLEFGADLIVAGIAINILSAGLTVLLLVAITGDKGSTARLASFAFPSVYLPWVDTVPFLGPLLNGDNGRGHNLLIYGAFAAIPLVHIFLYRTRFGLRLRSVGENSVAAGQAGISVKKVRYIGLALSGLFAGLGGIYLSMGYLTLFQTDMTAGRGYLGLAAVFLGARQPLGIAASSLGFGAFTVVATQLGAFAIPSQVVLMLPPLVTIAALVLLNARKARVEQRRVRVAARQLDTPSVAR